MKTTVKAIQNTFLLAGGAAAIMSFLLVSGLSSAQAAEITVYKSESCGCCGNWVDIMREKGHTVIAKNTEKLDLIKSMAGVAEPLQSCHTAMVDGYFVEGHVPPEDVERMLKEKPDAKGLAVPGMPVGSPGMEGGPADRYDVLLVGKDGQTTVYSSH